MSGRKEPEQEEEQQELVLATPGESLRVLAAMADLWDYREIGEDAEQIWTGVIGEYPLDHALAALKLLTRRLDFRPSPHEFIEACREVGREAREEKQRAGLRALPAPTEMPEDVRERVHALREKSVEVDRAEVLPTPNEDDFDEQGRLKRLSTEKPEEGGEEQDGEGEVRGG